MGEGAGAAASAHGPALELEPLSADRLEQVVDRVQIEGLDRVLVERGHEHDARRVALAGEVLRELDSAHARHLDID